MNNNEQVYEAVRARYGQLAVESSNAGCCSDGSGCCGEPGADVALDSLYADLYTADTSWLPQEVTGLSLGCGDPITLAALQPGQTVLDLGAGGGIGRYAARERPGAFVQRAGVGR